MSRMNWSLEDHLRAGKLLKDMDELLSQFFSPPLNEMPRRISNRFMTIDRQIMHLKSALEDDMARKHGSDSRASTSVYYGGNEPKNAETFPAPNVD